MSVLTVSTFLALLALLAAGVTAIGLVLVAIDAVSGSSAVLARVRGAVAPYGIWLARLVAAIRGDRGIRPFGASLALIGATISAYHDLVQLPPGLPSGSCSAQAPCTAIYIERFGFVTIPVIALIGFLTIATLLPFFSFAGLSAVSS